MANTYAVDCACGKTINVTSAAAGTTITCECGSDINVPGLSKLRRAAGQEAYITNAAEKIAAERNAGQEPAGKNCLECGQMITDRQVDIQIVCEQPHVKRSSQGLWTIVLWLKLILFTFVFWIIFPFYLLRNIAADGKSEYQGTLHGRTRAVETHFRICQQCNPNAKQPPSVSRIRQLLLPIPLYNQLFREFPDAKIKVPRTHSDQRVSQN